MQSKSDYKKYLIDIRDTIQSFLDESASHDDTVARYRSLLKEYRRYRKANTADPKKGIINGILYHHNVSNFSKLSALFALKGNEITNTSYHGDTSALSRIKEVLAERIDSLDEGVVSSTVLDRSEDLTYTLYVCRFSSGDAGIIVAALSSSYYFRDSVFRTFCEFIHSLVTKKWQDSQPAIFDIVSGIKNNFRDFLENAPGEKVSVQVYMIRNYDLIFSHLDTYNMVEATRYIERSLMDFYPAGVRLFMPTPWIFIISSADASFEKGMEKSDVSLRYKDISLPYRKKRIEIDRSATVDVFLDEVYRFENEVMAGDRAK